MVCPDDLRPVSRGWQYRALLGHPLTHPDMQVLEEDEECLSDQLKLPCREVSVYLRRQSRNRHSAFRSELGDWTGRGAGVGRGVVGAQRWSQRARRRLSCWAGWRGTPKYSREDRDAEAEPQGVFSQKGGEMKGHSQPPPHTVWFTGSSHTHQVCTQT